MQLLFSINKQSTPGNSKSALYHSGSVMVLKLNAQVTETINSVNQPRTAEISGTSIGLFNQSPSFSSHASKLLLLKLG